MFRKKEACIKEGDKERGQSAVRRALTSERLYFSGDKERGKSAVRREY